MLESLEGYGSRPDGWMAGGRVAGCSDYLDASVARVSGIDGQDGDWEMGLMGWEMGNESVFAEGLGKALDHCCCIASVLAEGGGRGMRDE